MKILQLAAARRLLCLGVAVFAATLLTGSPASADMLVSDLRRVDVSAFPQANWSIAKEAGLLEFTCLDCGAFASVQVKLMEADPGMERSIRSGKTTAAGMLSLCKRRAAEAEAECKGVEPIKIKNGVGFLDVVEHFDQTNVARFSIYSGDRLLLIESAADNAKDAAIVGRVVVDEIASQIVR